jgi:DHA2 family multidrug resistance protein
MLGPAIGPTLGGYIVDNYSWPWIFYINLPVGLVGLVMVSRVVQDPPYLERVKGGVDWWGMGLLVVGLGALQTLLEQGEQNDWFESTLNVAYAGIATACLVMFIVWELTVDKPAVNLRVLKNRSLATGTLIGAVLGAVLFSTLFLLPIYMQEFLGYDAMQTGLALMPRSLVMLVAIPIVGAIYNKTSPRVVISFGLLLGAFTCFQMSRFTLTTSTEEILIPQMIQGVALACIFIPLSTVALATIDRKRMSDATGLNNLVRQLGGSFGVAIFAALLTRYTTEARQGLIAHIGSGDPTVMDRIRLMSGVFARGGADAVTASSRTMALLDAQVGLQASMLGFERAFFLAGLVFAASIPLVVLLDEGRPAGEKGHAPDENHMAVEI